MRKLVTASHRMSTDAHERVAALLKSAIHALWDKRRMESHLCTVRRHLDEWAQREYSPQEFPRAHSFRLYHAWDPECRRLELSDVGGALAQVRAILGTEYPDCAPVRELLRRLGKVQEGLSHA